MYKYITGLVTYGIRKKKAAYPKNKAMKAAQIKTFKINAFK